MRKTLMPLVTGIVADFSTIFVQDRLLPAPVFEAMQVYVHPHSMKGPDLVKKVEDTAVIYRIGYIQAYNM